MTCSSKVLAINRQLALSRLIACFALRPNDGSQILKGLAIFHFYLACFSSHYHIIKIKGWLDFGRGEGHNVMIIRPSIILERGSQ